MPPKRKRRKRTRKKYHIFLILFLVAAAVFFFIEDFEKEKAPESFFETFSPGKKPELKRPEPRPSKTLPQVAIVIDDLGLSRKLAQQVLDMGNSITLSILPQRKYSLWIAEEGNRRGHDIIVHLPMEATKPLKLGPGGMYSWMSDSEIRETAEENIRSVPYIDGASNHMGSFLTKDKRTMGIVMQVLKEHRLFFFDSLTTAESVGFRSAKEEGLSALRRDVFLDDADSMKEIEVQWNRLITIAQKTGQGIAIGHPRKNTLAVLNNALKNNTSVTVVPLSDLIDN